MMSDSGVRLANKCIILSLSNSVANFKPRHDSLKPVITFRKFTTDPLGSSWCSVIKINVFASSLVKKGTVLKHNDPLPSRNCSFMSLTSFWGAISITQPVAKLKIFKTDKEVTHSVYSSKSIMLYKTVCEKLQEIGGGGMSYFRARTGYENDNLC